MSHDKHTVSYNIHKLIYSKHTLERAKSAHPFGQKIQSPFLRIGRFSSRWQKLWIQNLRDKLNRSWNPSRSHRGPRWKKCFFLPVTSHWSRTLCSWWPALARPAGHFKGGWEKLSILCCGKPFAVAKLMISSCGPFRIKKGTSHRCDFQIGQCRLVHSFVCIYIYI